MNRFLSTLIITTITIVPKCLLAENTAEPPVKMKFVTVGDLCNRYDDALDDTDKTRPGRVDEIYEIGKYDVTADQYCAFLNAVASDDTHALYDTRMETDENISCIIRKGDPTEYSYFIIDKGDGKNRGDFPVTYVSLYSAMRFCNWMEHHHPIGKQDMTTTESGSYTFQYYQSPLAPSITANNNATYHLPSNNQWFKAAYYTGQKKYWNYSTESMTAPGNQVGDLPYQANYKTGYLKNKYCQKTPPRITPVGSFTHSASHYGAYDMSGNVFQWTFTRNGYYDQDSFIVRGGSWKSESNYWNNDDLNKKTHLAFKAATTSNQIGFRLVKEPKDH